VSWVRWGGKCIYVYITLHFVGTYVPKMIKIGDNLTKFWKKQKFTVFFETRYIFNRSGTRARGSTIFNHSLSANSPSGRNDPSRYVCLSDCDVGFRFTATLLLINRPIPWRFYTREMQKTNSQVLPWILTIFAYWQNHQYKYGNILCPTLTCTSTLFSCFYVDNVHCDLFYFAILLLFCCCCWQT